MKSKIEKSPSGQLKPVVSGQCLGGDKEILRLNVQLISKTNECKIWKRMALKFVKEKSLQETQEWINERRTGVKNLEVFSNN